MRKMLDQDHKKNRGKSMLVMNSFINELHTKLGVIKAPSNIDVSNMSRNSSKRLVKFEKSESIEEASE